MKCYIQKSILSKKEKIMELFTIILAPFFQRFFVKNDPVQGSIVYSLIAILHFKIYIDTILPFQNGHIQPFILCSLHPVFDLLLN